MAESTRDLKMGALNINSGAGPGGQPRQNTGMPMGPEGAGLVGRTLARQNRNGLTDGQEAGK
jgi:hypothetical protein